MTKHEIMFLRVQMLQTYKSQLLVTRKYN